VEQQLPAGLREGEIAEFVEDHEVEAREIIGEPSLAACTALGLELIDEIDGGEKRPRDPARLQLRAMAMARCVLPVPVPPTRTT
jgi:hypothetical protein